MFLIYIFSMICVACFYMVYVTYCCLFVYIVCVCVLLIYLIFNRIKEFWICEMKCICMYHTST